MGGNQEMESRRSEEDEIWEISRGKVGKVGEMQ